MARKPPGPRPANLTPEQMRSAIPRLEARLEEVRKLDPNSIMSEDDPLVRGLSAKITSTLSSIYGEDTHEYARLSPAAHLDDTFYAVILAGRTISTQEIREGVERGRNRAIALLQGEAESLKEALPQVCEPTGAAPGGDRQPSGDKTVFVVHGHDTPLKIEVALMLERAALRALILHEQANEGRTIIEKFEDHGGSAGFAVIILTPDDLGGSNPDNLRPRARQNVIGEMFWFAGRLGRNRVCALKKGDVEMPSDFAGIVYTEVDDRGAWKAELLRELQAAGYNVDWRKALA